MASAPMTLQGPPDYQTGIALNQSSCMPANATACSTTYTEQLVILINFFILNHEVTKVFSEEVHVHYGCAYSVEISLAICNIFPL